MGILLAAKYNKLVGQDKLIKTVIKYPDNLVVVFNAEGQILPEYKKLYENVKECVLKNAPPEARFFHAFDSPMSVRQVKKENW